MNKRRYRIMAGTAVALILAAPLVSMAKNAVTPPTPLSDQMLLEIAHASVARSSSSILAADDTTDEVQGSAASVVSMETAVPAPALSPAPETATAVAPAAPPPDPLASLDPADRAVAENIRDLLADKANKLFAGAHERAAVEAFYSGRNFAPLWTEMASKPRGRRR